MLSLIQYMYIVGDDVDMKNNNNNNHNNGNVMFCPPTHRHTQMIVHGHKYMLHLYRKYKIQIHLIRNYYYYGTIILLQIVQ